MKAYLLTLLKDSNNPFEQMVNPVIGLINSAIAPAISLVGAIGAIYCIILGTKLARAEEQQDRDKAKKALQNAIVGFLLIFVLLVALRLGIGPLSKWMEDAVNAK